MKKKLTLLVMIGFTAGISLHAFETQSGIKGGMAVSGLLSKTDDFWHAFGYDVDWISMGYLFG